MTAALYIALTTTNAQQNGWKVLAYGLNADAVEAKAREIIGDPAGIAPGSVRDIYAETEHKNLRVVSKTDAKKFGVDYDDNESWFNNHRDAVLVK